ncbi:hypothetical protein [Nocardioides bruguierae]|uniref:hypothetical protein n=1 Tax=Nocardioides bruguierae TaxID=2945102 RepID=UPI002021D1E2|nr:hypothetical protein [Nocardioides bruguierae]MCL8026279.1 hypothetical protein [Nocardioides bruguierae]
MDALPHSRRARPRSGAALLAVALLAALLALPATSAEAGTQHRMAEYGKTAAKDRAMKRGCKNYSYRYRVRPPTQDAWGLETFLIDRDGEQVASGAFLYGGDPRHGTGSFRFCRSQTRAGRFTIRAKLTYYDGWTKYEGWIAPTHFRIRKR